jgi:hypothetical protein
VTGRWLENVKIRTRVMKCGDVNWVKMGVMRRLTSVVLYRLTTSKYFRIFAHGRGLNSEFEIDGTILSVH